MISLDLMKSSEVRKILKAGDLSNNKNNLRPGIIFISKGKNTTQQLNSNCLQICMQSFTYLC